MKKTILILGLFIFSLYLTACSNNSEQNFNTDAKELYTLIKEHMASGKYMDEDENKTLNNFKKNYLDRSADNSINKKTLNEMEALTLSYQFLVFAQGTKNAHSEQMYKDRINTALITLDKQFNTK